MRNLLLEKDKKRIRREYTLRLFVVTLLFALVTILLSGVFLLPSYFLSGTKKRAIEEQRQIIEQSIAVREQEASLAAIVLANEKLSLIAPPSGKAPLLDLLETAVAVLPPGVSVTEIFYTTREEGDTELHLSGVANEREDLLAFQNALRGKPVFKSVTLPISNLAADRNISFSLNLLGSF